MFHLNTWAWAEDVCELFFLRLSVHDPPHGIGNGALMTDRDIDKRFNIYTHINIHPIDLYVSNH